MKTNLDKLREDYKYELSQWKKQVKYMEGQSLKNAEIGIIRCNAMLDGLDCGSEAILKDVLDLPYFLKSHFKEGDLEFIKREELKQLLRGEKK